MLNQIQQCSWRWLAHCVRVWVLWTAFSVADKEQSSHSHLDSLAEQQQTCDITWCRASYPVQGQHQIKKNQYIKSSCCIEQAIFYSQCVCVCVFMWTQLCSFCLPALMPPCISIVEEKARKSVHHLLHADTCSDAKPHNSLSSWHLKIFAELLKQFSSLH